MIFLKTILGFVMCQVISDAYEKSFKFRFRYDCEHILDP